MPQRSWQQDRGEAYPGVTWETRTPEQAGRGLPVAGQRLAIQEYAREHNLHLGRVFVDEARSGGTDQREQFQLMMHLAHRKPPP